MPVSVSGYVESTDALVPRGLLETARYALHRYGFVSTVARYLLLKEDLRGFVRRGKSPAERAFRKDLLRKFAVIQGRVACAHPPYQFVLMAQYLLDLAIPGPIVECGCFKGGSTAKLSLLAERTGRRLYVCDSFQGLPEPESDRERLLKGHGHGDTPDLAFRPGEYAGRIDEVRRNVDRFGCLDVSEFIPGFFSDSLPGLDIEPAFVFIDVDYVSSARDCLRHLWPRLAPGGYWFTHEAAYPDYILGILAPGFWREVLGECPPVIMGAGSGLSGNAPGIAYFRKGAAGSVPPLAPRAEPGHHGLPPGHLPGCRGPRDLQPGRGPAREDRRCAANAPPDRAI
ncbi:MAG TPA: TylF/MycF/NovP-related O-methyltransferase [Isosphaeraceae bacterium]|nr:TylF/MycF/NovP-related O-methyltransferase [Isosphaeraceae bacterium]